MAYTRNGSLVVSDDDSDDMYVGPGDIIFANGGDDTIRFLLFPIYNPAYPVFVDGGTGIDKIMLSGRVDDRIDLGAYTNVEIVEWHGGAFQGELFFRGDFSHVHNGLHLEVEGFATTAGDHRGPPSDLNTTVGATNHDDVVTIIGSPFGPDDRFITLDLAGGDDTAFGSAGRDFIGGKLGDDILLGFTGHDWLEGGDGNDILAGGADNDVLLGGSSADWIEGNDGDDALAGGGGNDRLVGGVGNDWLSAGAGYDLLLGGAGVDVFEFHHSDVQAGNWVTIADFGAEGDWDGILLEGFPDLAFYQDGANTLIYAPEIGLIGGIIVQNTTVADVMAHLA